jgi:ureidoacrylate peracid hydrolase
MDLRRAALIIVDLQNDFLHAKGAYARGGQSSAEMAALPGRLKPLAVSLRAAGGSVISTHFTLVEGRDGEPMVSPHLKTIRPFLRKGDFKAGSWGHALIDELQPADFAIEKIAYSAFYMTRLEWVLRKAGVERLIFGGIVTNGGVSSTARDAHVRDFDVTVLSNGCAAFSDSIHHTALDALRPVARIMSIAECASDLRLL